MSQNASEHREGGGDSLGWSPSSSSNQGPNLKIKVIKH